MEKWYGSELEELNADGWRERMIMLAQVVAGKPKRVILEGEAYEIFVKASTALATMYLIMDEKLVAGYVPPNAWRREGVESGNVPSSDLHRTLKEESELIVQTMLERIERRVLPKDQLCAKTLMEQLGKLLSTLALFTSESVRIACLNNLRPETENTKPHLALVHDADIQKG